MKYYFCNQLDSGICFNRNYVSRCTVGNNKKNQIIPIIIEPYNGEDIDWNEFFNERDRLREEAKNGNLYEKCRDCQFLFNVEWDEINSKRAFNYIQMSHWLACNSNCIYCDNHIAWVKNKNNCSDTYDSTPIIKKLIEGNYINENTRIDFAGGEPTLYYKFNELLELFLKVGCKEILVHSNCIIHSKQLEKGIKNGNISLCVSIDAGTKKIHEKIKGVKSYDKVWKNIKKYAKAKNTLTKNYISLKYIIVPGINDSEKEIDIWMEKAYNAGVNKLLLNADNNIYIKQTEEKDKILKRVIELSDYFRQKVKQYNINYKIEYNIITAYILNNRRIPEMDC